MPSPNSVERHFVHFYKDEESLRSRASAYLAGALRQGESAIAISRPQFLHQLKIELHRQHVQGPPFGPGRGEFIGLDAEETLEKFTVRGQPDAARFDAVVGTAVRRLAREGKPPAAYGDMVAVLCERGQYTEAVKLEGMWNALLAGHPGRLYCGYPLRLFASSKARAFYRQVCAAHHGVHHDGIPAAQPAS